MGSEESSLTGLLAGREALIESLHAVAQASRWHLPLPPFAEALARSARKRFCGGAPTAKQIEDYLASLHLEDLALACACAEGIETAWEYFVKTYRGYLRASAGALLGRSGDSAEACELADTIFADLYGWNREKPGRQPLFLYFHGRSKLSTWLRAVLAQRRVNALREQQRFDPLDETGERPGAPLGRDASSPLLLDPDRPRYVAMFRRALHAALARLDPRDAQRLTLYYAEEQTLAETGQRLGEHESSVSRNLERLRRELRSAVEVMLRAGLPQIDGHAAEPGLSEDQIALCFEYAVEDAPLDFSKTLGRTRGPEVKRPQP